MGYYCRTHINYIWLHLLQQEVLLNTSHLVPVYGGRRTDDGSISIDCAEVIQLHGKDASMSEDAAAWHGMRMHEKWSYT